METKCSGKFAGSKPSAEISPGNGAKIIMTTVMDDPKGIMDTFKKQCDAYLIKPVDKTKLLDQIRRLGLLG